MEHFLKLNWALWEPCLNLTFYLTNLNYCYFSMFASEQREIGEVLVFPLVTNMILKVPLLSVHDSVVVET